MPASFVITADGSDYTWSPSTSAPSTTMAIAELPAIIDILQDAGVRSVVDFGAGRGRNVRALSNAFASVLLVETDANVPHLQRLVAGLNSSRVAVQSWEQYRRKTSPKVDAVLICFVVHTLPTERIRSAVIRANVTRLRRDGRIVFVTPRKDPKYSPGRLKDAVEFDDGIVRLYHGKKTFSFYRNYTRQEFLRTIDTAGLRVDSTVPSPRRWIFVTRRAR